jgi:hypothetical protein
LHPQVLHTFPDSSRDGVTGGLKVLNFGGIKMPTSTAFGFETRGCVDAEIGGLSHVARTAQSGNEHQRDRQRDRV